MLRSTFRARSGASLLVHKRFASYPNEHYKSESKSQKEGSTSNATRDAVYASHGESKPDVAAQTAANTSPENGDFQPGLTGEQVSGHGPGQGEGAGGTSEATSPRKVDALRQKMGLGSGKQHRHLHVSARQLASDPSKLRGEQNEHLVHSEADKPDKMPAVRDDAELPSKKSEAQRDNQSQKHPMADKKEPLGYGSAPEGLASANPKRSLHTSAFLRAGATQPSSQGLPDYASATYNAPAHQSHVTPTQGSSREQYKRTYVRGVPEPNSYRLGYDFVDYTTPEAYKAPMPSSAVKPSSTSTEPANPNTTEADLEKNDLKLPPDFDTATRGQWANPIDQEKVLPPAGDEPSGGTRELREEPRGPRDAPATMEKEQSASVSDSTAKRAKEQEAETTGADPASLKGAKDSPEAKPAHPEDVLREGQPETTLAAGGKTRKARSGPTKAKKA